MEEYGFVIGVAVAVAIVAFILTRNKNKKSSGGTGGTGGNGGERPTDVHDKNQQL